jgi:hypothetical protein
MVSLGLYGLVLILSNKIGMTAGAVQAIITSLLLSMPLLAGDRP